VQHHGFAVNLDDAHEHRCGFVFVQLRLQVLPQRGGQAQAAQAFEIDLDHE
jgi:hypothetical protein